MTDAAVEALSPRQAHALLDILSHQESYREIGNFRYTSAIEGYGPPFEAKPGQPSSTPALQPLLTKFITCAPGIRDVDKDFWKLRIYSIIHDFQDANLSESYDKGVVGIRRTVASAMSALFEYPSRGIFAGFDAPEVEATDAKYNLEDADDLNKGFRNFIKQTVYSDILDRVFEKTAQTDRLSDHEPVVQACHTFALVNLASFLHYTLILSPKGQSLLALADNANKLIPYGLVKQTLKIGNAATMINAMVKVVLAKMSVSSVTNWMGLTSNADEGMNLLQTIISTVLNWEVRDLKSRSSKIQKSKEAPSKDQLSTLQDYVQMSRQDQEKIRKYSMENSVSIVHSILLKASAKTDITAATHEKALEYLSLQLSIRDRQEIIKVLCRSHPDHLTQAVRDGVAAYEPLIRRLHNSCDLSSSLGDLEAFIKDLIKLAKLPEPSGGSAFRRASKPVVPPTVGDFVLLLKKHQYALHKFLHQIAKNGPDIMQQFHEYAHQAVPNFRREKLDEKSHQQGPAGDLKTPLDSMFATLPEDQRGRLRPILEAHAAYIDRLHAASAQRLREVVSSQPSRPPSPVRKGSKASVNGSLKDPSSPISPSSSSMPFSSTTPHGKPGEQPPPGPGAFLARWQDLLDSTQITPEVATGGSIRRGGSGSVLRASAQTLDYGLSDSEKQAADDAEGLSPATTLTQNYSKSSSSSELHSSSQSSAGNGKVRGSNNDDDNDDDEMFEEAHEQLEGLGLLDSKERGLAISEKDAQFVFEQLGQAFREELARRGCTW